jgi:hypothetical protein
MNSVFIVRLYEFNHQEKTIDPVGLWEDTEYNSEEEARIQF